MDTDALQSIKQRFHIIGQDKQLNRAIEIAMQVAKTDLSILVTGESGVGKEFFPQIVHAFSSRKHAPYFAINCGAIPEGTIDSELFGHEKGAFTDAKAERRGYFEIANGGTLFLDEVGELPMSTQVRLLRVLESGEFIRVGGNQIIKANVRVVAATNLDMPRAIRDGKFREDLFFRLNTVEIKVPSLRDRKDDIPLLFRKFSSDFCNRYSMPPLRLNEEATELLKSYYWQGNIRQLKNVAEQVCILETNHDITAKVLQTYLPTNELSTTLVLGGNHTQSNSDSYNNERNMLFKLLFEMKAEINNLKAQIQQYGMSPIATPTSPHSGNEINIDTTDRSNHEIPLAEEVKEEEVPTVHDSQRETIRKALERTNGNRKEAAKLIDMPERTLYRKIKEYNL